MNRLLTPILVQHRTFELTAAALHGILRFAPAMRERPADGHTNMAEGRELAKLVLAGLKKEDALTCKGFVLSPRGWR